jgi:hypothetical protein
VTCDDEIRGGEARETKTRREKVGRRDGDGGLGGVERRRPREARGRAGKRDRERSRPTD